MAIVRDTVYAALYARLKAQVTLCRVFSRKWVDAQNADTQPMMLVLEGNETPSDQPPAHPVWTLHAVVIVYVRTNELDAPGAALSAIIDQVESALEMQAGDSFTTMFTEVHSNLGVQGVQRAFISGEVSKEDGSLTQGQGLIEIPISIIVSQ